jgi:hypothetical protein
VSKLPGKAARDKERWRRGARARTWLVGALTAMTAVALGLVAWFAATSVAWFAAAPTGDPIFGPFNRCLVDLLPGARVGFAVSPDARAAAAFGPAGVAECRLLPPGATVRDPEDEGVQGVLLEVAAVTEVAFDFQSVLWVSSAGEGAQAAGLYRKRPGRPLEWLGDAVAMALAGHAGGAVALDVTGRLYSVAADGDAPGFADLGQAPPAAVELSVDSSGEWLALVGGGALALFEARTLEAVRVEAPCDVAFLWWLARPGQALVECEPAGSLALIIDAATGAREAAPAQARERSRWVPGAQAWVKDCDRLPCSARAP